MKPYYKEAFDYVNAFHPIKESVFKELYELASLKQIKPNQKLLKQGIKPQKIYLITKGVLRSYLTLYSGKEVTTTLYYPFMFFASFRALLNKESSNIVYEALTDCDVFEIDFEAFNKLGVKNVDIMILYSKILEFIILKCEDRYIELSHKDASERYLALRNRIPDLDNVIPQYQIAASLGITPVQLSRIRAKLKHGVKIY